MIKMAQIKRNSQKQAATYALALALGGVAHAADLPLEGVTLNLASMNDQYAAIMVTLAPKFEAATGADLNIDILDYGSLLTKTTADFVGDTAGYDIVTMDIVWAGQFAESGFSVELSELIERDADELGLDDIYPKLMEALGQYDGKQIAYPLAGYANVLAYRTDLFEAAGLAPPETMEELVAAAYQLTDPDNNQYGFVANGQKGAAVAQDWMQYNAEMGGSIISPDGAPVLNSQANIDSLGVYRDLFQKAAPPGAADYDWGGREEAFRQGLAATMQTWSVGAPGYSNPEISKVVGKAGIAPAPHGEGLPVRYGIGGWGLAINADISDDQIEAAWTYIKWITSPEIHKELNMLGAGSFIRKSELADPDLNAKYPFLPVIHESFEKGDGDYRPRIPEYPEIQDILGTAVNSVLVGDADPKAALDKAQAAAEKLF